MPLDVRVVNGVGTGTVKHVLCDQPGELAFVIDAAGAIKGRANTRDTVGCTLRGIHRVLPCGDCHRGGNYSGLSPACIACHRDDALRAPVNRVVHITTMECTGCHTVSSFKQQSAVNSPPESVCQ